MANLLDELTGPVDEQGQDVFEVEGIGDCF